MSTPEAGQDERLAASAVSATGRESLALRPDLRAERLRRHAVNMGLWTAQGWLAMFFTAAGCAKITQPITRLEAMLGWPGGWAGPFVRLFGVCEVLLGLAVLAPLVSRRLWPLMLTASRALFTLAAVAAAFHALQGPLPFSGLNAVVAVFCILVVVGRVNSQVD